MKKQYLIVQVVSAESNKPLVLEMFQDEYKYRQRATNHDQLFDTELDALKYAQEHHLSWFTLVPVYTEQS